MRVGPVVLALVGTLISGCTHDAPRAIQRTPTPSPTAEALVPWLDEPAVLPASPAASPTPSPRYRACRGWQLSARPGPDGAAAGNDSTGVVLVNRSTTPCSLSGYATRVVGIRPDGRHIELRVAHGTMFDAWSTVPADLTPGDHTVVTIATSSGCEALNRPTPGPGSPYDGVQLTLPAGGVVSARVRFDTACGVGVTPFGDPGPPPADPVSHYPGLAAALELPTAVAAGQTLHYVVTLVNHGATALRLDACPAYQESYYLGGIHPLVRRLNCAAVPTLLPGQRVRYAMELPVADGSVGGAKFSWWMPAAAIGVGSAFTIRR